MALLGRVDMSLLCYELRYIINKYNVKNFVFSTVPRSALCFSPKPRSPLQMQCAAD